MDLGTLNPEQVEELFTRHGAVSVTFSDAGDQPVLEPAAGETPLWNDTRITGLFGTDADFGALKAGLRDTFRLDTLPAHAISELQDRPWEREWLRDFGPMRFGRRLWVLPGDSEPGSDDAVSVRLDPGLAFGTGTHATTAMCLEWLDGEVLDGKSILDVGCGSGILAIAALKLGCREAMAFDIDPQAQTATVANAGLNRVGGRLVTSVDADDIEREYDVVMANILAAPLIELRDWIVARLGAGSSLVLSGILSGQVDDVLDAYGAAVEFEAPARQDRGGQTWVRLNGRRHTG